jgi:hypothetical protein
MGWQATVIVVCDALEDIRRDPQFGEKLAMAVLRCGHGLPEGEVGIQAGAYCTAAVAVEKHHADYLVPVLVGNYGGKVIQGATADCDERQPEVKQIGRAHV